MATAFSGISRDAMNWLAKLGTLLSQTLNVLLFNGHPDESLSARAYHEYANSRLWRFIYHAANWIFGDEHCHEAARSDLEFADQVLRRWL